LRSIPNAKDPAIVDGDVTVFDWALTFKTMQLGLEAQQVIALRMYDLQRGARADKAKRAAWLYV
jgi:hypothetical protein